MKELTVKLKWDDEGLGKGWMNIDNLKLCLFTENHTKRELLEVEIIEDERVAVEPLIKEA